ncbi:putative LOV domain-containing protein, partial [Haematococcus lacustris]
MTGWTVAQVAAQVAAIASCNKIFQKNKKEPLAKGMCVIDQDAHTPEGCAEVSISHTVSSLYNSDLATCYASNALYAVLSCVIVAMNGVERSGKSLTRGVKNKDTPQRPIGEKAKRPPTDEEEADPSSCPWLNVQRPPGAASYQDTSFCMEDETTATQVEAMMYSCCVSDPGTARNPLVYVSPGFETLTGYARDEVLGVNCKLLQGKAPDRSKVSTLTKSLEVDKFAVLDLVNFRKDGRPFNNLVCIVPVFDGYGNLIKFVGIQCDLDEKSKRETVDDAFKQAWQEQVRHHLTTFALCDSSEPGAPILTVSPGFTSLTGFNQPDMLGQTCLCLCGPDTSSKSMRKLVLAQQALKPTAVKL